MPLSIDEATKRYESHSQNIQDAILTMESYMGNITSFTFDLPQVIGNLDKVDTASEEHNISSYIKALEEYKKIVNLEKKRRALREVIDGKMRVDNFKANLKLRRCAQRLGFTHPYQPSGNNERMSQVEVIEH